MDANLRAIRIALPVEQIRRMDDLIVRGIGGFGTRAEFIQEAVESQLVELSYPDAPPECGPPGSEPAVDTGTQDELATDDLKAIMTTSLRDTAVRWSGHGHVVGLNTSDIQSGFLFGLHNRDYPSLWALSRIASITVDGPVEFNECLYRLSADAWKHGELLQRLESQMGGRLTALFPVNHGKPQAAEGRFQQFAVGYVSVLGDNRPHVGGPLFAWQACSAELQGTDLVVGCTAAGHELLDQMEGLTASIPHAPDYARRFMAYLKVHAVDDWTGLQLALAAASAETTRDGLITMFSDAVPEWTESVASTNSSSYIARAREWGLVVDRQVAGRYAITDLGLELMEEVEA